MATRRHMFLALLCAGIPGNPEGTGRAECQPRAGGGPLADTLISFIDFGPIGHFRRICACAGAYGAGACSQAHMRRTGACASALSSKTPGPPPADAAAWVSGVCYRPRRRGSGGRTASPRACSTRSASSTSSPGFRAACKERGTRTQVGPGARV